MARPDYLIRNESGTEEKIVSSAEMLKLTTKGGGWICLGKSTEVKPKELVSDTDIEPTKGDITPQFTPKPEVKPAPELETPLTDNIETPESETKVQTKVQDSKAKRAKNSKTSVPSDLKCPHCGITARTKDSYARNHGDNCIRK